MARLLREVRGLGWSGAQDSLAVGEGALQQWDRLGGPPRGLPSLTRFMQTALGNIVSNCINLHKTGAFRRQFMI